MRVLVAVLFLGCAAAQSPTPWTGTRDSRNLECNSTADGAVLLNGQDVVSRSYIACTLFGPHPHHNPHAVLSLPRPDGDQVQKGVGVSHLKQHAY